MMRFEQYGSDDEDLDERGKKEEVDQRMRQRAPCGCLLDLGQGRGESTGKEGGGVMCIYPVEH